MPTKSDDLWEIELVARSLDEDAEYRRIQGELAELSPVWKRELGIEIPRVRTSSGFLLEGAVDRSAAERLADILFTDRVSQTRRVRPALDKDLSPATVTVMRKPGVMDPASTSAEEALAIRGFPRVHVRTFHRVVFDPPLDEKSIRFVASGVLANDAVDQVIVGPLTTEHLGRGKKYELKLVTIPIRDMDDEALERLSREGQLYLNLTEMRGIGEHFAREERDPTDIELETIAQTWSEHCSHKTFRGPYTFNGRRSEAGLLKDTIMRATREVNRDWCVSVFSDNAGIIRFDDDWNVSFKVETHNHPSAIEPYGGANTGIGGVIRDILGAGLGGKPICNTNVFAVAHPDTPHEEIPPGVLHPRRVLRGVVSGVRDYGNRMGIPTVNGAVYFDQRYLANPLVYCGTVGVVGVDQSFGKAEAGDLIVAMGGRTGRDGIHGATFSSGELTHESDVVSGGAVQIGNAIAEKKVVDVVLQARDRGLFRAITDCGAGGFSSAVGEMGESIGALVDLERAPVKYEGLTYDEIWISEAQERMVLAVPPEKWLDLEKLAASEGVEAVVLGTFEPTGRLVLRYEGQTVGDLSMEYLHHGRPAVERVGVAPDPSFTPFKDARTTDDWNGILNSILASPNVCSKEWIVRQYDHEVQGGSVIKPLVGVSDDGPSDAAVVRPVLSSMQGVAIACGMNPRYGDLDPYRMAAAAVDEAIRNVVAVGGDPDKTAILDNFCWGRTERPEVFGSLCQAAFGCRDAAIGYRTPFISGKDSLNNEYISETQRIAIPPSLLISALAIVPDIRQCVTMDLKKAGNALILVGLTREEMGGSHYSLVTQSEGGEPPIVDCSTGLKIFTAVHGAIRAGLIRSCHDLSEGGLAVSAAEMAFAGNFGATIELDAVPSDANTSDVAKAFAESSSRFLMEVETPYVKAVLGLLKDVPAAIVGEVTSDPTFIIRSRRVDLVRQPIHVMKKAWQSTLAW